MEKRGSGPRTWGAFTLRLGDEVEPVKENEKKQLLRDEENQSKGPELTWGFNSGDGIGELGDSSFGGVVGTKNRLVRLQGEKE